MTTKIDGKASYKRRGRFFVLIVGLCILGVSGAVGGLHYYRITHPERTVNEIMIDLRKCDFVAARTQFSFSENGMNELNALFQKIDFIQSALGPQDYDRCFDSFASIRRLKPVGTTQFDWAKGECQIKFEVFAIDSDSQNQVMAYALGSAVDWGRPFFNLMAGVLDPGQSTLGRWSLLFQQASQTAHTSNDTIAIFCEKIASFCIQHPEVTKSSEITITFKLRDESLFADDP